MIHFLFISSASLLLLLLYYQFFLEHEKMNRFKRWLLWGFVLFSLALPFFNFTIAAAFAPLEMPVVLLEQFVVPSSVPTNNIDLVGMLWVVYLVIAAFLFVRFMHNLLQIQKCIRSSENHLDGKNRIVLLDEPCEPHTFLKNIFVNKTAFYNNQIPSEILAHERVHAQQLHSVDVIVIELLKIVFWFNPLFYAYKNAMQRNHEFLADENVLKNTADVAGYQTQLLAYSKLQNSFQLTSNINYSLNKKRFIMMTQTTSNATMMFKKCQLMLIAGLLFLTASTKTFSQTTDKNVSSKTEIEVIKTESLKSKPDFRGGMAAFYQYFMTNFNMPSDSKLDGKIIVSFVVKSDGSLSDIVVKQNSLPKVNGELIRVLQNSPKWIPGRDRDNVPVNVQYLLPISIVSSK